MKGRCRYRITSTAEARARRPPRQEATMIAMPNPEVTSTWSQDTLRQYRVKYSMLLFYASKEKMSIRYQGGKIYCILEEKRGDIFDIAPIVIPIGPF